MMGTTALVASSAAEFSVDMATPRNSASGLSYLCVALVAWQPQTTDAENDNADNADNKSTHQQQTHISVAV